MYLSNLQLSTDMALEWINGQGITACCGVEVNILGEGAYAIKKVELSLQKNHIQPGEKKESVLTLDQLAQELSQGPVAVSLTGKGVLIKRTAKLEIISEQSLRQLFPGCQPEEF